MKYDIGDIVLFSNIKTDYHYMIINSLYDSGVLFYDLQCVTNGMYQTLSVNTLDRSCKIVQKGKR